MQGTHESAATTPEFDDILYEVEDSFAVITINRPDSFNSFRSQTVDELIEALTLAWGDNRVRSIILTGSGQKAFCAGGDVKQKAKTGDYGPSRYGMFRISELHKTMRSVPKPIIAAVNGVAIGGGNVLNTLCDITIAATHARRTGRAEGRILRRRIWDGLPCTGRRREAGSRDVVFLRAHRRPEGRELGEWRMKSSRPRNDATGQGM